jgi:hypothetical protein
MWCVYDSSSIVIDMYAPVACFDSFWDASDYVGDHPEQSLYIEAGEPFVPVITEADIDAYLMADGHPTDEGDPRDGFDDSPRSMAKVLYFLGWVAEFKSMNAQSNHEHFGYETLLYAYHDAAKAI